MLSSYFFVSGINEYVENYNAEKSCELLPGTINVDEAFEEMVQKMVQKESAFSRHIVKHLAKNDTPRKLTKPALSNSVRFYTLLAQVKIY